MIPLFPRGARVRRRPRLLAALAIAGAASAAFAAASLQGAPGGDVIDARRGEIRALEAELARIDARADSAAAAHRAARRRAADLRARIAEASRALAGARRARTVAVARLEERVVALYREEPPSLVEVLLSAGGLTAAIDVRDALEAVAAQDRRMVEAIAATRERLTRLRQDLLRDRAGVEAAVAQSAARLDELRTLATGRRAVRDEALAGLEDLVARDARLRARRRAIPVAAVPGDSTPARAEAAPSRPAEGVAAILEAIALCESGGNPRAVSASGQYRGKYQFDQGTWESLGGSGDPASAPEAEQDRLAGLLYAQRGAAPWPVCGSR